MKLICKKEALDDKGNKVMNFTQGVIYDFEEISDPKGWETTDDNGNKEVFFNLDLMFKPIYIGLLF